MNPLNASLWKTCCHGVLPTTGSGSCWPGNHCALGVPQARRGLVWPECISLRYITENLRGKTPVFSVCGFGLQCKHTQHSRAHWNSISDLFQDVSSVSFFVKTTWHLDSKQFGNWITWISFANMFHINNYNEFIITIWNGDHFECNVRCINITNNTKLKFMFHIQSQLHSEKSKLPSMTF